MSNCERKQCSANDNGAKICNHCSIMRLGLDGDKRLIYATSFGLVSYCAGGM